MNKYEEALDFLFDEAAETYELDDDTGELHYYDLTNSDKFLNPRNTLKELVDWSEENFTHILRVNKVGFPTRIAFHTEKEAYEFARKNDLKGCHLDSIQFGKVD